MLPILLVCLLPLLPSNGDAAIPPIRSLGSTAVQYPAFAHLVHNSFTGKDDLVVTTFSSNSLIKDSIYVVRDVVKHVGLNGGNNLPKDVMTDELFWPNEVGEVPADVLNRDDLWWVGSGFLPPGKDDGSVALIEVTDQVPSIVHDISTVPDLNRQYWWHKSPVVWRDMNNDGRKDALTTRAFLDSEGSTTAQMVWFEQPSVGDPLTSVWNAHVLFSGPDASFCFDKISVSGYKYEVIISTQYFSEKLVISWIERDGMWTEPSTIKHRVIDAVPDERYFECQVVDLNADGNRDLLVSISSDKNGKLIAYEIPADFRFDSWIRHNIADGFKPQGKFVTEGNGAPGATLAFYPMDPSYDGRLKPMIILTGDDDGNIYLFESNADNDPSVWAYTYQSVFYAKGTVGSPAVKDIDGDGYTEVFIPAYTDGELHVYTFKP